MQINYLDRANVNLVTGRLAKICHFRGGFSPRDVVPLGLVHIRVPWLAARGEN